MLSLGLRAAWELLSELASRHNSVLLPLQQVTSSYLSSAGVNPACYADTGIALRVSMVERESGNKKQLLAWFVEHAKYNSNKNSNELIMMEMVSLPVQMPIIYVVRFLMVQGVL